MERNLLGRGWGLRPRPGTPERSWKRWLPVLLILLLLLPNPPGFFFADDLFAISQRTGRLCGVSSTHTYTHTHTPLSAPQISLCPSPPPVSIQPDPASSDLDPGAPVFSIGHPSSWAFLPVSLNTGLYIHIKNEKGREREKGKGKKNQTGPPHSCCFTNFSMKASIFFSLGKCLCSRPPLPIPSAPQRTP